MGNWHQSIERFGYMSIQTYVAAYWFGTHVASGWADCKKFPECWTTVHAKIYMPDELSWWYHWSRLPAIHHCVGHSLVHPDRGPLFRLIQIFLLFHCLILHHDQYWSVVLLMAVSGFFDLPCSYNLQVPNCRLMSIETILICISMFF